MHENSRVNGPDRVSESLQTVELMPLAGFSLVNLELNVFSNSIRATADNNHHCSNEDA